MSLDNSLKAGSSLSKHRNVLTRTERVAKLKDTGKFDEAKGALGLPKVGNRRVISGSKSAKKTEEAETTE